MTRLKIVLLCISVFILRWMTLPSPLPANWANESVIRYTATILDKPEYTDSKTIVRKGIWYIRIKGYKEIIPGSRVIFEGEVEPKWVLGKVVQIKMVEPKITGTKYLRSRGAFHPQAIMIALGNLREKWVATLQKTLPEPMASLAAGILLGIKGQMPQDFYQALVNTGTLHIVAASGYNVSIVAEVLMKMTGGLVSRAVGIWVGVIGIGLYVVIAGGSASVVRAGIMGSLTLVAYYFGRPSEARRLLWVTAFLMLTYNPLYIVDVGFQLSFVATAGLLDLEPWIVGLHSRSVGALHSGSVWEPVGKFLSDYLYPTLAATVATLPIIWWHFGRVSLISPFVNILVLPFVPLMMGMTVATLFGGQVVAWMTYPILAYMVWMIRLWG